MNKFFSLLILFCVPYFTYAQIFQLNGNTVQVTPRCYRLTDAATGQAGSIFSTTTINLNTAFDYSFFLNFGCTNANGGDGIAFVLQNSPSGSTALGGSGGGMGFANGPTISPSLAIEFDTFDNTNDPGWPDIPADHIDIIKNGVMTTNMAGPVQMSATSNNVEDCNCHTGRVTWDPSIPRLRIYFDGALRLTYNNDIITNFFGGNAIVYWGFTAGTGVLFNMQTVSINFADAGNNQTICSGSSTTLNATGGTSYSWSPSTGLSNSTSANPVASPTVSTTYTLTATNSTGCSDTSVVKVFVNPRPSVNAGADVTVCSGSSVMLNGSGTGSNYLWTPSANLNNVTSLNPLASPTATITYTLIATSSLGCTANDAVVVTVSPAAIANAGNTQAACSGSPAQLTGSGGTSYSWSPSTGLSSSTISNPSATVFSNTTYTLTVTNAEGCTGSDTVSVHILPAPTANAGTDAELCLGSSIQLHATGGVTYLWSPTTGLSSSTSANPFCFASANTTYTVTAVNATGCSATDAVSITVNVPGPAPTLTPLSPTICAGSSVTITASGCINYSWFPSTGLSSTFGATVVASPTATTNYTCAGTDTNGCVSSRFFSVTVIDAPVITSSLISDVLCPNSGAINISANGGSGFQWSNGETTEDISGLSTGTYSVTVLGLACNTISNFSVGQTPLSKPQNVAVTNLTSCSARLNWNAVGGLSYYSVRWKEATASLWNGPINIGNVLYYDFAGLNANTVYYFSVEANCTGGATAGWVNKTTTTKICTNPTNISVSAVTSTSAIVSWTQLCPVQSYQLRYRKSGTTSWTIVNTSNTSLTINNLLPSTTYQYRVNATCNGGATTFTSIQTFITLPPRNEENSFLSFSVFPNPNNGTFMVYLPVTNASEYSIEVINVLGQKIFATRNETGMATAEIKLNNALAPGIYFVVYRDTDQSFSQNIIVER